MLGIRGFSNESHDLPEGNLPIYFFYPMYMKSVEHHRGFSPPFSPPDEHSRIMRRASNLHFCLSGALGSDAIVIF
jgi:hypothetical protein